MSEGIIKGGTKKKRLKETLLIKFLRLSLDMKIS